MSRPPEYREGNCCYNCEFSKDNNSTLLTCTKYDTPVTMINYCKSHKWDKRLKGYINNDIKMEEELIALKKLCRFQYLTLGYYATEYNYDPKNIVYHPLTGDAASGIMFEGGRAAREAQEVAVNLGFSADQINQWPGPGEAWPQGM